MPAPASNSSRSTCVASSYFMSRSPSPAFFTESGSSPSKPCLSSSTALLFHTCESAATASMAFSRTSLSASPISSPAAVSDSMRRTFARKSAQPLRTFGFSLWSACLT